MNNQTWMNDDLLWDYMDGLLPEEDRQRVDAYLRQHPEWKARLEALLHEKQALFAVPLEKPERGFSDGIMASWAAEHMHRMAYQADPRRRDWVIYAIAGAFGLFILVPVVVMVIAALQATPLALPAIEIPTISGSAWARYLGHPALQLGLLASLAILLIRAIERYLHQKRVLESLRY